MKKISKAYGLILSLTVFALSINILPSLITTFSSNLQVSLNHFGLAISLQYISFFLVSLFYGFAAQRGFVLKESTILTAMILIACSSCFLGRINSYGVLLILLIFIGGCGGVVESVSSTLLTGYEEKGSSRYLNLSQFFYCLGAILSPAVVALMFAWEKTISFLGIFLGGFLFLLTGMVLLLLKRGKAGTQIRPAVSEGSSANNKPARLFIWYILAMFFYVLSESCLASWIPLYFEQCKDFTSEQAALALSSFWTGLAAGRLFYSFKSTGSMKKYLFFHCLSALVLSCVISLVHTRFLLHMVLILIGFGCAPLYPMFLASCRFDFGKPHFIMYLVSTGSIGAVIGPLSVSLLFSLFDISVYFIIVGIFFFLSLGSIVMIHVFIKTFKKSRQIA